MFTGISTLKIAFTFPNKLCAGLTRLAVSSYTVIHSLAPTESWERELEAHK